MSAKLYLLDKVDNLCESEENKRRQSLWDNAYPAVRGEIQWHGIPKGKATNGDRMPITVEEMNAIWADILGFEFISYYENPEYYLEYLLKMKIEKFLRLKDDTPIDRNIPIWLGIPYEAAILGQNYHHSEKEEPTFDKTPIVDEDSDLEPQFDFGNSEIIQRAIKFHEVISEIVGENFNVIFPYWIRGPQGTCLYIRGYEGFLTDLYINPELAHRCLQYVTEAAKSYTSWRAEYINEPIGLADLFNDDIPIMSPEHYKDFVLPYEKEIRDFHNGIYYWHSCGNTSNHISEIIKLKDIKLFDLGPGIEDKSESIKVIAEENRCLPTEIRFSPDRLVQNASQEQIKQYLYDTYQHCLDNGLEKFVLRVSGMSLLYGAEKDLEKMKTWIDIARSVQNEMVS